MAKKNDKTGVSTEWYIRHSTDTGSPEFQIYTVGQKVALLQQHVKENHKDFDAKRTLLRLVAKRRTLLRYLKTNDLEKYSMVSKATWLKV